jgi:hypothetical protein
MDVTLAEDAMVPRALKHRFQLAVSKPEDKPSSGNDRDPTPQPPQTQSFIGAPLDVGKPAVVIAPPLKGPRWVVAGGCCDQCRSSKANGLWWQVSAQPTGVVTTSQIHSSRTDS